MSLILVKQLYSILAVLALRKERGKVKSQSAEIKPNGAIGILTASEPGLSP